MWFIRNRALVAFAAATMLGGASSADEFSDWFDSVVSSKAWLYAGPTIKVEWIVEQRFVPPPADLAQIRQRVAGRPDHPDRSMLEVYDRRLAGTDSQHNVLWLTRSAWRCNQTMPFMDGYVDFAGIHDDGWQMTRGTLVRIDRGRGAPPGRDFESEKAVRLNEVATLLSGGLSLLPPGTALSTPRLAGKAWTIDEVVPFQQGTIHVVASGEWDAAASTGKVEKVQVNIGNGKAATFVSTGWRALPGRPTGAATQVMRFDGMGQETAKYALRNFEAVSTDSVESMAVVPAIDSTDPVRGPVTFTAVEDYRPGKHTLTRTGPNGPVTTAMAGTPLQRRRGVLEVAGWCSLAALVALLIGIRIRASARVARPMVGST